LEAVIIVFSNSQTKYDIECSNEIDENKMEINTRAICPYLKVKKKKKKKKKKN
jgi:hypothetical protein